MSTSNSLPCNKRRKLSISEVSSLASTSLRTEFVYSVRESTHFEHPSQLDQAGKDSGMLDISQELTEEDICIQSSLPHYCDHIFGRLVGSSQPLREHSQPDGDIGPLLHILESQGFTVTVGSKSQRNKTDSSPSSNGFLKLPPQLFHSPLVSPPRMCPPSDSGHLGPDSRSSLSQWKMCHTTHNVASGFSPIQEQKLKTSIARKNGRSSKPTTTKVMYSCPPNCVTLADCTHDRLESTVCLLALVLQGLV